MEIEKLQYNHYTYIPQGYTFIPQSRTGCFRNDYRDDEFLFDIFQRIETTISPSEGEGILISTPSINPNS